MLTMLQTHSVMNSKKKLDALNVVMIDVASRCKTSGKFFPKLLNKLFGSSKVWARFLLGTPNK